MNLRHSTALRAIAYGTFYRLPLVLRRRIVRAVVPKYVVGSVVFVHDSEAPAPGRLLLLRQPPGVSWTLPAGLLQRREAPIDGALRELHEETGLKLTREDLVPATPNAIVHAKGWVDMCYHAFVPASTAPVHADGAEVLELRWYALDDLPKLSPATGRLLGMFGIGPAAAPGAVPAIPTRR
ncbi:MULTISPECIES: NUDIX hydrolase [Catenuloplanes]|uniref:8-oxo-dGTP pyrophosphatase MutT (NUDIX family) n=1 Tax=Catenuloplanes niger TaxID=587534 RepID=A0AAE3ZKN2_9ACTN|nr:NUDIX hydrolase [Catenuloplanes niger]MDR7321678.1 8-oxo-dGTP pyrophosphatase MutT (NUDIX family) [Catenuloplanes niger]